MNSDVILHPLTAAAVEQYLSQPAQAIGLIGPVGAGKAHLAQYLATRVLGNGQTDAVFMVSDQSGISIEMIRELQRFLKLRKPGIAAIRRAIIIENAGLMSDEAQNALLKTLEEPPADTIFILTADGSANVRPTIYSRLQKLYVHPLGLAEAQAAFNKPAAEVARAHLLSGGNVGLLAALLEDKDHELTQAITSAKEIIQAPAFERLQLVDSYAKQKENLPLLFYALQRVIDALLAGKLSTKQLQRLVTSSRALFEAERDLRLNVNTKLLLTDLFLQL